MSPRRTTRPLYFWCFVSNSAFFKWQRSINEAKCTFLPSFLASSITSDLFLTFALSHAGIFSSFSHSLSTAAFGAGIFIAWGIGINLCRLWSSGSSPASDRFRGAPRGDHLSTRVRFMAMAARVYTGLSASRNTFSVSTITDGNARARSRSSFLPLRWPDCTLSRLRAEEYDRPVTQSIPATPEPSSRTIPTPRLDAGRPLEPWVCHHTWEPTVLSRASCRPSHLNFDSFHQPCLLPWRNPLLPPKHSWLLGRDRWGLSSPYHVATTYPCGQPGSPSFATHWRYCHADWTVPRLDVNSSFPPCVCHPSMKGVLHTQVRDPRESAAACLWHALGATSLATILSCCSELSPLPAIWSSW